MKNCIKSLSETLNELKDKKYINSQNHPTLPLKIWKYTSACVYAGAWDETTLSCRGMVTDPGGVVNNCVPKFFNYSEERGKYSCDFSSDFKVFEKLDGSLIQVFLYEGEVIVTSSGRFESDHAMIGKRV